MDEKGVSLLTLAKGSWAVSHIVRHEVLVLFLLLGTLDYKKSNCIMGHIMNRVGAKMVKSELSLERESNLTS